MRRMGWVAVAFAVMATVAVWGARNRQNSLSDSSVATSAVSQAAAAVGERPLPSSSDHRVPYRADTRPPAGRVAALQAAKASVEGLSAEQAMSEAHTLNRCLRLSRDKLTMPEGLTEAQQQQFLQSSGVLSLKCPPTIDPYRVYALAQQAAESGSVQAQLDFALLAADVFSLEAASLDTELILKFKRDTLRFLDAAMRSGSVDALSRLSDTYEVGRFGPKDPVRAYAYSYARNMIVQSPISAMRLDQLGRPLDPSQIKRGQELGQQYFQMINGSGRRQ